MAIVDHRRAVADRNRRGILDATERLLAKRAPLSMAAIAAEAGLSRPTLYAHFKTLPDVLEAAVKRSVDDSLEAIEGAEPEVGPADEALERMLEASWRQLAGYDALARGAAEYLPTESLHRTHAPLMAQTAGVIERGQANGTFRRDLSIPWLVNVYYSLIHAADELARTRGVQRSEVLTMLKSTIHDLFAAPETGRAARGGSAGRSGRTGR
jgi:TetR/AcrR family transcriptional regulator, mexCD-oprJ operon repressor